MRIVRYELAIQQYQQIQPLWPGRVLSVGARRHDGGVERPRDDYGIDMWCFDNDANRPKGALPPVLGVWIIGTGNPIPQPMFDADALFHGTVDMNDAAMGVWHVFTAVVGEAAAVDDDRPELGSVDDMVERIKARHRGGAI